MSHRKTLTQLGWFKVAFFAPLAVGAIVAGFIAWNDNYFAGAACLTSECINDVVSRFKVPITIMALIFPAVALVASHHRSAQTAAQIERTDNQIEKDRNNQLKKECDSALISYLHFRRLYRIAIFLTSKSNVDFKNGNGQAKQRIEEIYDGWKHANNSDDCVRSIIYADNWATDIDLIDTFEMMIQVARSGTHLQEDRVLDNSIFEGLNHTLNVFLTLSHLHARDIGGLKDTDLSEKIEKNAKQSLCELKYLQGKAKKAKRVV